MRIQIAGFIMFCASFYWLVYFLRFFQYEDTKLSDRICIILLSSWFLLGVILGLHGIVTGDI